MLIHVVQRPAGAAVAVALRKAHAMHRRWCWWVFLAVSVALGVSGASRRTVYAKEHRHGNRDVRAAMTTATTGDGERYMGDGTVAGSQLHHAGRHVCLRKKLEESNKQTLCKPAFKNFSVRCHGNQICKGVRLVYEPSYIKEVTVPNSESEYVCCPGWAQLTNKSHGCNKAICSKACHNGGKCVKPELCACLKGYTGKLCEINLNKVECSRNCQNGGTCISNDKCKCRKGFTGQFCDIDIDECKEHKPCDHICYNNPGSFTCQCKEDFILQDDGQSCRKEIEGNDEALEAKDLELDILDKRLLKLETIVSENQKNEVTKKDLASIHKDIGFMTKDISLIKHQISHVENYKNDVKTIEAKLNFIEKKANKVDDLLLKYDRMKKCAFYNKICI